jgi:hypothetical protein
LHSAPFAVNLGFMRESKNPAACKFSGWDRRRLFKALARVREARLFRRIQAVPVENRYNPGLRRFGGRLGGFFAHVQQHRG